MDALPAIMDLPLDVVLRILTYCRPQGVAAFSQTCRAANNLIYLPSEQYLWRQLYLAHPFDHPEKVERERREAYLTTTAAAVANEEGVDYRSLLIDRLKAERAAVKAGYGVRDCREALQTLSHVLEHLPVCTNTQVDELQSSYDAQWLEENLTEDSALLRSDPSNTITTTQEPCDEIERTKARLRLCVLSSFKHNDLPANAPTEDEHYFFTNKRNRSRCFVYDLSNYSIKNRWGPFTLDNGVNWVHVEHLMNVVWMNLCDSPLSSMPRPRIGTEAFRPHSSDAKFTAKDWAGVEGSFTSLRCCLASLTERVGIWSRYICFMDYRFVTYAFILCASADPDLRFSAQGSIR